MFTAIKLIKPFSLPPTQIAIGIILVLFLLSLRRIKWSKVILTIVLIYYYSLATEPVADLLSRGLEGRLSHMVLSVEDMDDNVEAVVILSGGTLKGGGLRPEEELNGESLKRLWYGARLGVRIKGLGIKGGGNFQRPKIKNQIPIIFSGGTGNPFDQREGEGEVAKEFLLTFGFPEEDIWVEDSSRDTYESAIAVKKILDKQFPQLVNHKVILVTSAIHMPRAFKVFRKLGLNPIPAPSSYQSGPRDYNPLSFLPNISSFRDSTAAINEWIGLVAYWVRGRI
jgi:uncharacterized SAM-binding protein YcdF (DUF218 family)